MFFRSSSSSSGDNSTDDSGIHSKSTSKDSPRLPPKSIIKYEHPVKIDRVAVGRKPVRKLPAVPNSKQAHIVQLKTEPKKSSPRTLPKPPNDENSSPIKKGLRLTNFFRSVKFPKNKKIQPAPVRIFGRDLSELAKATNLEGELQNTNWSPNSSSFGAHRFTSYSICRILKNKFLSTHYFST